MALEVVEEFVTVASQRWFGLNALDQDGEKYFDDALHITIELGAPKTAQDPAMKKRVPSTLLVSLSACFAAIPRLLAVPAMNLEALLRVLVAKTADSLLVIAPDTSLESIAPQDDIALLQARSCYEVSPPGLIV